MIKITEKYYIDVDSTQYTVYERKIAQSGKSAGQDVFQNATYYSSLEEATNNVFRRMIIDKLNTDKVMTLIEAVNEIKQVKDEIKAILNELTNLKEEQHERT